MNLSSEASKLVTNKYFLYFMVFLAATNILGYLVTNKFKAVIFFVLVSILTYQFSKNMAIVLLVALISTNFLMTNKMMREGLENQTAPSLEKIADTDPQIASALPIVKNAKTNDEVSEKMKDIDTKAKQTVSTALSDNQNIDINNTDLNQSVEEDNAPKGFGEQLSNNKKGKTAENFGPRLDYAATIEQSYQNLDEILGSDSIKQLTNDTQKLMQQQQNLFNTMNQMVPVLQGAQDMLKGFDVSSITSSLKGMSSLGSAPTVV
jgi:hypothetical protein